MIGVGLLVLALAGESLAVQPFGTFDGRTWAGIEIGTAERELKKKFETSKTKIADPASVFVKSDRKTWVVSAILSAQGGKGDVVGIEVEHDREGEPLATLESIKTELGSPDVDLYPEVRFEDWSLAYWKSKGIAAVISNERVTKILMARPETIDLRLGSWSKSAGPIAAVPLAEVGDLEIKPDVDVKNDTSAFALGLSLGHLEARLMRDYRGPGWVGTRDGRSSITITVKVDQKGKKEFQLSSSAQLSARTSIGSGNWSSYLSDTAKDSLSASQRVERLVQESVTNIGKQAEKEMRRLAWQAEWRPFYALARP